MPERPAKLYLATGLVVPGPAEFCGPFLILVTRQGR